MPAPIDEATVRHVAHLARLKLSDDEVHRYTQQLVAILEYVQQLNRLNVDGVEPTAHALPIVNVLRPDEPREPLGAEKALANAPQKAAGFFALPKVLDQEGA